MVNISNPFRKAKATEDHFRGDIKFKAGQSDTTLIAKCRANGVEADVVVTALTSVVPPDVHRRVFGGRGRQFAHVGVLKRLERDIVQKKLIPGWEQHEFCRGPAKLVECCEENWRALVDYAGVDEVFDFKLINESTVSQVELIRDEIDGLHGAFVEQGEDIKKKVVEAATDISKGVGKVLVAQSEVLVAEGRDNKNEIKETVNQRADQQMAFNAKMRQEMEQARLDREEAKRERLEAKRERMALTLQMKRMNRLLVQHAADQPLPELESEQLAFEYQDRGAEPVLTSPRGSSYERLVEPPSAGSGTLGVTPRTNSTEICRALGPKFSLLRDDRPSPESPEAYDDDDDDDDDDAIVEEAPLQGAVAAAALDHETVDEAPLQEATALSPVDAPPPADIASPAPAPAAEDDKGGVKALSTPARPTLERQIASVSRQFWEKHEEGKLRKIKDRTNKPSPLPQPSPPAEEG